MQKITDKVKQKMKEKYHKGPTGRTFVNGRKSEAAGTGTFRYEPIYTYEKMLAKSGSKYGMTTRRHTNAPQKLSKTPTASARLNGDLKTRFAK